MKYSDLAEKRRQIEESLLRNDQNRQDFIQKNPHFFSESSEISSNSLQESFGSSILKNDSDIFQQKAQKFNTIKSNLNNKQSIQQRIGVEDSSGSVNELIEEHIQNKYDKPLNMESSSDLEYSQSHQNQRKTSNSILKKQQMNNSSGIEEFSFQNNFGLDNSNVKISNIFLNNNNYQNNNITNSQNNLQSILKQDNAFLSNNFQEDIRNLNEQKNNRNNINSLNRDSDLNQGSSRQSQLQLIEEERNSQQNFYSQQQQSFPYQHQYQLSSTSSRKGQPSLFGNELVQSSQQILQSKHQQNEKLPIYSYNSQGYQNSENVNYLNFSNSAAQKQWQIGQSAFQQQQQSHIGSNILNAPSFNDNSYQSSILLHNQQPANNSSIGNSSSLRANYPFNQPQSNNNKDHDFFRLDREKRQVEFPLDMKQKYEKIFEIQTSPDKNEAVNFLRQPSPYSQYQYEKQQAELMRLKQIREQQNSYQNSERRENNFTNSQRSENSFQMKNSQYKSPTRQDDSIKNMTVQFESQRNRFQQELNNHVRKYSPHSRTSPQFKNTKDQFGNSKSFQMSHLQDVYDSYRFDEDESSSPSSSSSEESLQSSMGHSVRIQIQKALAKQNKSKQMEQNLKEQKRNQKKLHEQESNGQNNLLQQYVTNESDRSHTSNIHFNNQMEEDINQMKTQVFNQPQTVNEQHQQEEQESESQQQNQDNHYDEDNELEYQSSQNENNQNDIQNEFNEHHDNDDQQQINEESLDQIPQQKFKHKKNQNKHPTLLVIDNTFEEDDNNKYKNQYQRNYSLADVKKYDMEEINPQSWKKYNQNQKQNEKKQLIEEEADEEMILKQDEQEQSFQNQVQEEVNGNINSIYDEQNEQNESIDINENLILDIIDDLFQSISHEKDEENDEEKRHQYELLQIRLMNLMPQDRSAIEQNGEYERNMQLESYVEELINIKKLFLQILISKQNKSAVSEGYIDTLSPQEYQEDIQNLIKKLETLYLIQKKLISKRQNIQQADYQYDEEQIQNLNKSRDNNIIKDNQNYHDVFERRRNSTPEKSLIELNEFIQNQEKEYIQREEDFMQRFNDNFQFDNQKQQSQLGIQQSHNNIPKDDPQKNLNDQKHRQSQQEIEQNPKQQDDQNNSENEDEEKLTHNDLISLLDQKYNKRNSIQHEQEINDKQKNLDKSEQSAENEELESQLQQIRKNAQLKQDIQNMLKDKSDVFEKFKYRLEMKLNNQGEENDPNGKKSALDDVDLSFQSEMKYEDSLKYSSLYREQAKKLQEQGKLGKQGRDDHSEKSAPASMSQHDKNQCDESYQNDKSELDKTLQEKLKHELFLDLENFRRSDIFRSFNNRKIKDFIEKYKHFRISQQVMQLSRGMKVMANAKLQYQRKQENLKQNAFNVIKWYSEYSQVKNRRRMQVEQNTQLKNLQIKTIAFQKIQKFCAQHKKWIEAIHENNKMMKLYKIVSEWKKIINYKAMKRQADLYYKNTLFQKFKNNVFERKNSVDVKALMHYSNKLQSEYFTLFCQTAKELRRKRLALKNKVKKINNQLLSSVMKEWRQYASQKKQEKNDYIPIQICIKDTITKPKIQPNQTLKDYKRVPITTQKTIKVTLPPDSSFKS